MSYGDSSHQDIQKILILEKFNIFKSNENKNFRDEIGNRKFIYVDGSLVRFETGDKIVEISSKEGFDDAKIPICLQQRKRLLHASSKICPY